MRTIVILRMNPNKLMNTAPGQDVPLSEEKRMPTGTLSNPVLAQQLLEATRLPVEEVARRCGFSSAAALRQHFRRLTGTAPAAYRTTFGTAS